jgi:hypothetical protein
MHSWTMCYHSTIIVTPNSGLSVIGYIMLSIVPFVDSSSIDSSFHAEATDCDFKALLWTSASACRGFVCSTANQHKA